MRGGRKRIIKRRSQNTVLVLEQAIRWCLFHRAGYYLRQDGYYFTNLVTIYEAGSRFLNLVYGWCMAGVFGQIIEAKILSFDITFYLWCGIFDLDV